MSPSLKNMLVPIIIYLTTTFNYIKSETLNCRGRCGPCQFPDELCTLKCLQYESCKDGSLTCSTQDTEFCTIDCSESKACLGTTVYAKTVTQLTVNCFIRGSCEGAIVYAAPQSTVFINCDADDSCTNLVLHAYQAKHVYIACIGMNSCEGIVVECGTGDCILACLNNLGGVCGGAYLGCGGSPKCQINCSGNNKCENLRVDAASAIGFECIGTDQECQGVPAPFMLPTRAPTRAPSSAPTSAPTQPPTKAPTDSPTYNPTSAPTLSPTKAPTDSPTYNPTPAPTFNPTKVPSSSPTFYPTSSPTFTPTKGPTPAPTFNPTPSPTYNPTKTPTRSPTMDPTESPTKATSSPSKSPTADPTLTPSASPTEPTINPTASPTETPTKEPTADPTTASPTTPDMHPNNLAVQHNNAALANLSTNPTTASLLLVCIIFGGICCCCIPCILCIYFKFGRRYFDEKRRKHSQSVLDQEEVQDEQGVPFGDIEGDYSHYDFPNGRHRGRLSRVRNSSRHSRAASMAKDGYSGNAGASNSGLSMFGTNSLPFGTSTRRRNKKQLESLMEDGKDIELQEADDTDKGKSLYQDSEATKDIIRVTIWFIEKVKLPQYCELFILNGLTSLTEIKKIKNMRQLEMLGIERGDHQFDIMSAINILAGRGMYLEDSESEYSSVDDGRSYRTGATNGRRRGRGGGKRRGNGRGNRNKYRRHHDVELEYGDEYGDGQRETRHNGVSNDEFVIRGDDEELLDDDEDIDEDTLGPVYAAAADDDKQVWQIADVMDEDLDDDLTMTQQKKRSKKNKRGRDRDQGRDREQKRDRQQVRDREERRDREQRRDRDRGRDRDRIQPPKAARNERSRSKGRRKERKDAGKVYVRDIEDERKRGRGNNNNNGDYNKNKSKSNKVNTVKSKKVKVELEEERVSALDIISKSTKLENQFSEGNDGKEVINKSPAAAYSIHDSTESSELMLEMMNLGAPNHSHSASSSDSSIFNLNFRRRAQ